MSDIDKETLASMARATADEIIARIGPNTPLHHASALAAIADSWANFAKALEL